MKSISCNAHYTLSRFFFLHVCLLSLVILSMARDVKRQSCAPVCASGIQSKILLHIRPAGLGDRAFIIGMAGNLAVSLCATLYIDSPSILLSTLHTTAHSAINPHGWDRYLQFRNIHSNDTFISPSPSVTDPNHRYHYFNAKNANDVTHQTGLILALKSNEPFRWTINVTPWHWNNKDMLAKMKSYNRRIPNMKPYINDKSWCDHVMVTTPESFKPRIDKLLDTIGAFTFENVATLHIRRGPPDFPDGDVGRCNTTVPAIIEYIKCAMHDTPPKELIVFTDNTSNLDELSNALHHNFPFWDGHIHYGDKLITEQYIFEYPDEKIDNYWIYSMASAIMADSALPLEVSRCKGTQQCSTHWVCHPCMDRLATKLPGDKPVWLQAQRNTRAISMYR